jgi:hypothetical protein
MKYFFTVGTFIFFIAMICCVDNDGDLQPTTFLTINLKANFMESAKDKWIFATNEKGELLDAKQLELGSVSETLEASKPFVSIDLTVFSVYEVPSTYTFYAMETYKGFPSNETITLGTATTAPATVAGNAAISITNYSESLDPRANLKFSTKPYGSSGVFSPNYSGTTYSVSTLLYQGFDKVHIYGLRANIPVYTMVSDLKVGDAVSVDYNAFLPFQNFVPLNSFYGFAYVIGIENDESHFELVVSDKQSSADPRMLYIGTVPGFPKYLTYIASFSGFEYLKVGEALTSFSAPTYSTSVTNNTLANFKASVSGEHDYKYAQWRESVGLHRSTWIVHADNNTHPNIAFDFPQELKTAYPSLTKDGLELSNGSFVRSSGTYTYLDMLAERLKNVRKTEYEMYTMTLD